MLETTVLSKNHPRIQDLHCRLDDVPDAVVFQGSIALAGG
jgi:hypothetical protein